MRSAIAQKMLDKTPKDLELFVRLRADIVVRVHRILEKRGFTQKQLADLLEKHPSEISKWLGGEHNFTLRSLAKLEAELGEPIVLVPDSPRFERHISQKIAVRNSETKIPHHDFVTGEIKTTNTPDYSIAS